MILGLSPDLLLQPRIVLLAEKFSPTVTSSVVWLNEQGVDITLKRYLNTENITPGIQDTSE